MSATSKKFVYYDAQGIRHVRDVTEEVFTRILSLFDGNARSVSRSSGGLGVAMPSGIKFRNEKDRVISDLSTVHILLHCTDFDNQAKKAEEASFHRPKLLSISKIHPLFSQDPNGEQRFGIDFGSGLFPVHVVNFLKSTHGKDMVAFIEKLPSSADAPVKIQPYWVPKECLRWVSPGKEIKNPILGLEAINAARRTLVGIPEFLKLGDLIIFNTGEWNLDVLRAKIARECRHKDDRRMAESEPESASEGLLPFGLFEATSSVILG